MSRPRSVRFPLFFIAVAACAVGAVGPDLVNNAIAQQAVAPPAITEETAGGSAARRALLEQYIPTTNGETQKWIDATYGDSRVRDFWKMELKTYARRWKKESVQIGRELLALIPIMPPKAKPQEIEEEIDGIKYKTIQIDIQRMRQKDFGDATADVACYTAVDFVIASGVTGQRLDVKKAYKLSKDLGFTDKQGSVTAGGNEGNARIFGAGLKLGQRMQFKGNEKAVFAAIRTEIDAGRPVHVKVPPISPYKDHVEVIYGYRRLAAAPDDETHYEYLLHDVGYLNDVLLDSSGQVYMLKNGKQVPNPDRKTIVSIYTYTDK